MAKEIDAFGYFDLTPQEQSSETSAITATMAGIASGIIKVPEGVISLGAELIDLGFDTNLAAKVETAFDRINIFEEVADDRAIGKIVETMIQIGVPGGVGFKLASAAVKAKKAGKVSKGRIKLKDGEYQTKRKTPGVYIDVDNGKVIEITAELEAIELPEFTALL